MAKIKFISKRCTGCRACEGACKQENNLPVGVRWRVVTSSLKGDYPHLKKSYNSLACHHCVKPKCADACSVGAIIKDKETGIVVLDEEICSGCRACIEACPFNAMSFDKQKNKAGKCTLCLHRLKAGLLPSCVQTCMGLALEFEKH